MSGVWPSEWPRPSPNASSSTTGNASALSASAPILSFPITSARLNCWQLCFHMAEPSKYETFDRSRLKLQPLSRRHNDLAIGHWLELDDPTPPFDHPDLATLCTRLEAARRNGALRTLMMGAHVLRAGV